MALYKAIRSGKEKRKPYRGSKAFDHSCRNHGTCGYCESTRTHFDRKARTAAADDLKSYIAGTG